MEYDGLGDAAFCPDGVCDVNGVRTGSTVSPGLQVDFLIQTAHANVVVEIKRMKEIGLSVFAIARALGIFGLSRL